MTLEELAGATHEYREMAKNAYVAGRTAARWRQGIEMPASGIGSGFCPAAGRRIDRAGPT